MSNKYEEGAEARYRKPHSNSEEEGVIRDLSSAGVSFSTYTPNPRTSRQNDLTELAGESTGLLGVPDESLEMSFRVVRTGVIPPEPGYVSPSILPEVLKELALNIGSYSGLDKHLGDVHRFKVGKKRWQVTITPRMLAAMHTYLSEAFKQMYFLNTKWGVRRAMRPPETRGIWHSEILTSMELKPGDIRSIRIHVPVVKRGVVEVPDVPDLSELGRAEYIDYPQGSRLMMKVSDPVDRNPVFLEEVNYTHLSWVKETNEKKFQQSLKWVDRQYEPKKLIDFSQKVRLIHFGQHKEKRIIHGQKVLVHVIRPGLTFPQYWQLQFAITERLVEIMTANHKRFVLKLKNQITDAQKKGNTWLQETLLKRLGDVSSDFKKRVEARWAYWEQDAKKAVLAAVDEALSMPKKEEFDAWVEREWKKAREFKLLMGLPLYDEE